MLDNASYHNTLMESLPNYSWKKEDIQKWLTERGIFFEAKVIKAELYFVIKIHKPNTKKYIVDTMLAENGMLTLRLHPELNPIEKIWVLVKNEVAACNTSFKLSDVWKY